MREEIADKRSRMADAFKPLKEIRSTVKGTFQETKKSFEDLEWRLQTSSLDPKEENRLIAQIKELEMRLAKHQKLNDLHSAIRDQKATVEALKHDAQSTHEKILVSAESSARVHEGMMQLVKKLKEIKAAADEAHKRFLQARAESEQAEQELLKKVIEKKKLQRELFGNEEAERQRKRKEFVEKLAESGSTKLSQGKKVSLEEFKALMEQKKIFPTTEADQSPV